MKSVNQMNNVEKAKLLHQLLPDQMEAAIKTISEISTKIVDSEQELAEDWNNPILSLSMWVSLAKDNLTIIKKYDKQLIKSAAIFSDQLFDGYNAILSNHCIQQHVNKASSSSEYKAAIALLYHFEIS